MIEMQNKNKSHDTTTDTTRLQTKTTNLGLQPGREKGLLYIAYCVAFMVIIWSGVTQTITFLTALKNPASSSSFVTTAEYPKVSFLICPHFTTNAAYENGYFKPSLVVSKNRDNPTFHYRSSNGDMLKGEIFPAITTNAKTNAGNFVKNQAVAPIPLSTNMYRNTSAGCIAMTPFDLNQNITGGDLASSLNKLYNEQDQPNIGAMTIRVKIDMCNDKDNSCVPAPANGMPPTPLMIYAFSLEPGDYDHNHTLLYNLKNPCKGVAKFCNAGQVEFSEAVQIPPNSKGILALAATETQPPLASILCSGEGLCDSVSTFTHEAKFISLGATINNASETHSTYTIYYSASMNKRQRRVIQYLFTMTFNDVVTAMSGMISLLLLLLNKVFPKIEVERKMPTFVRALHPVVAKSLYCCGICGEKNSQKDQIESTSIENPAAEIIENPSVAPIRGRGR